MREAAKYYQMYDAFCRISMTIGTSTLATFFCFYMLTFITMELAAPFASCAGIIAFTGLAFFVMKLEMSMTVREIITTLLLLFLSPALIAIPSIACAANKGYTGGYEFFVPVGLFLKFVWFIYLLFLLHVRETRMGGVL